MALTHGSSQRSGWIMTLQGSHHRGTCGRHETGFEVINIETSNDKAVDKAIEVATESMPSVRTCYLLEMLAEMRLNIYCRSFEGLCIDGDSYILDTIITDPGILETRKLLRAEAMESYIKSTFNAVIDLRQKHIELKKESI
ncbi:hypothetical protein DOTSEDRAFT_37214 [Dothistroma septosporum NZE10]|uniref:Uncharacterized protein n=1 Tax=Dothistroma septosporum (strain NZE10 / CBS 128990) TaxID=675120 RepID=N1PK25_DOTSN|nr:hypothetical protein DOTSEDRAFT_37214 [Dothistroma septosporum NZE10]